MSLENNLIEIKITNENEINRLDKILACHLTNFSRSQIQEIIENGNVSINGNVITKPSHKIKLDNILTIEMPPPKELSRGIYPVEMNLDIVYEDNDIIVVNKSNNLIVHPADSVKEPTLLDGLMHYWGGKIPVIGSTERPCVVHRLDKNTSGLIVLAKTQEAYLTLINYFKDKIIEKKYLALVAGNFSKVNGTIDTFYGRNPNDRKKMTSRVRQGKRAISHYKVLCNGENISLVEVKIDTGRTHQIRVHMAENGHPIIGDPVYGEKEKHYKRLNEKMKSIAVKLPGQALHAYSLSFKHPITGDSLHFTKLPPNEMLEIIKEMNYEIRI